MVITCYPWIGNFEIILNNIKIWNMQGEEINAINAYEYKKQEEEVFFNNVDLNPYGKVIIAQLISGDYDKATIKTMIWNHLVEKIATIKNQRLYSAQELFSTDNNNKYIFSPDSNIIATSGETEMKFWTKEGNFVADLPHKDKIADFKFSLDSNFLYTASNHRIG